MNMRKAQEAIDSAMQVVERSVSLRIGLVSHITSSCTGSRLIGVTTIQDTGSPPWAKPGQGKQNLKLAILHFLRNRERKVMSEKRKKTATILLKTEANGGNTAVKVELFPAAQWERERDDLFRLRVNGAWVNNEQAVYFSVSAVNEYLAKRMQDVFDEVGVSQAARREVHVLDPCWVDYGPNDHDLGIQLRTCQARVVSDDTVIGMDGRQYVAVSAPELGGVRLMAIDTLRFYDKGRARNGR